MGCFDGSKDTSFRERERFQHWQRKIEAAVHSSNEGVQLILERLVQNQLGESADATTNRLGSNPFLNGHTWSNSNEEDPTRPNNLAA